MLLIKLLAKKQGALNMVYYLSSCLRNPILVNT